MPAETTGDDTPSVGEAASSSKNETVTYSPSQTSQVMSQDPQINTVNIAHPRFVMAQIYTDQAAFGFAKLTHIQTSWLKTI